MLRTAKTAFLSVFPLVKAHSALNQVFHNFLKHFTGHFYLRPSNSFVPFALFCNMIICIVLVFRFNVFLCLKRKNGELSGTESAFL